jgi:hypothetical protein
MILDVDHCEQRHRQQRLARPIGRQFLVATGAEYPALCLCAQLAYQLIATFVWQALGLGRIGCLIFPTPAVEADMPVTPFGPADDLLARQPRRIDPLSGNAPAPPFTISLRLTSRPNMASKGWMRRSNSSPLRMITVARPSTARW